MIKLIISVFLAIVTTSQLYGNLNLDSENILLLHINSELHQTYGLSYPMTYEVSIPSQSQNLTTHYKFEKNTDWIELEKRTVDDFFNGINIVRYDYQLSRAFISLTFNAVSDSIYIKVTNNRL